MTRRPVRPTVVLAKFLENLSPLEAAEAVARPSGALAHAIARLGIDRARLVVDAYEERVAAAPDRRKKGVFYTPPEVVEAMLDRVPLDGVVLDPAAGAGAFVLAMARRLGIAGLSRVHACDVDASALAACALALEAQYPGDTEEIRRWHRANTHVVDFLRDPVPPAELVIGNPPYGIVDPADLAARFPELEGEIDLFACFLLRAAKAAARVALLVPDTWLTNAHAARLRKTLADGGVARIVDFGKPFTSARDTRVHAVILARGAARCAVESLRAGRLQPMLSVERDELAGRAERGWNLYRTEAEGKACAALEAASRPLRTMFDVVYGLRTGGNAKHVVAGAGPVPLVGGLDLDAYDRHVTPRHLGNPEEFRKLVGKQLGRWKLGIQRIRTNSLVPWRRWIEAAPLLPGEVGLDSLTVIAPREASEAAPEALFALLGVLNSSVLNRWYRLTFTDVNVKPVYVEALPVPPLTAELAAAVRKRLDSPGDLALERAIDRLVADAYGLDDATLAVLEEGYWEAELANRPMPARGGVAA